MTNVLNLSKEATEGRKEGSLEVTQKCLIKATGWQQEAEEKHERPREIIQEEESQVI